MDTVRDLGSSPRRLVQQWRVPCGYGSLRRPVSNLVQAAHIRRTGFEQSGPYRRSRQTKGIPSVAVQYSYPVPSCGSLVRLQREAAANKAKERAQRKAVRQQMREENANPRDRRPHNRLLRPLRALHPSSRVSTPSIQARQPLTPLHVNSVRIQ